MSVPVKKHLEGLLHPGIIIRTTW